MFIDTAIILIRSGKGGNGCMHMLRLKGNAKGGPDGGDGGKVFVAAGSDQRQGKAPVV